MNLTQHPDTLERIAAGYALGTLRGPARRRFEAMARAQPQVRAAALVWQSRLSALTELQEPVAPDAAVWTRIQNLVQADQEAVRMQELRGAAQRVVQLAPGGPAAWWRSLLLWRAVAAAGIVASTLVLISGANLRAQFEGQIAQLRSQLRAGPQIAYVAVLSDDKSAPAMLVTFDARNRQLILQRVGKYQEASDKSLQLWALPPAGSPRSLGVLGRERKLRLSAAEADVREVPMLAVSLEPKGGVPGAGGPTGPVLFKGAWVPNTL